MALDAIGSAVERFGHRNLLYLAFVVAAFTLGRWIDKRGAIDPDDGGGLGIAALLWCVVSAVFFVVNLILAIIAGANKRPLAIPLLACALPVLCIPVLLMLVALFH